MERVDVRVEPEFLAELDVIAERAGLSRSAIIRDAVISYVMENREGMSSRSLKVEIPNRIAERLIRHVDNGDATDAQAAVVMAIDFWLRDLEDLYLRRKPRMDKLVAENVKADESLRKLEEEGRDIGRQ